MCGSFHEGQRRSLDHDLGTIQIDGRGYLVRSRDHFRPTATWSMGKRSCSLTTTSTTHPFDNDIIVSRTEPPLPPSDVMFQPASPRPRSRIGQWVGSCGCPTSDLNSSVIQMPNAFRDRSRIVRTAHHHRANDSLGVGAAGQRPSRQTTNRRCQPMPARESLPPRYRLMAWKIYRPATLLLRLPATKEFGPPSKKAPLTA